MTQIPEILENFRNNKKNHLFYNTLSKHLIVKKLRFIITQQCQIWLILDKIYISNFVNFWFTLKNSACNLRQNLAIISSAEIIF